MPTDAGVRMAGAPCARQFPARNDPVSIDQFLADAPSAPSASSDTSAQELAMVLLAFVGGNLLVAFALGRVNLPLAMLLLRTERFVFGAAAVIGTVKLVTALAWIATHDVVAEAMQAQATLNAIVVVAAVLFVRSRHFINRVHILHRGVPHPTLSRAAWRVW